MFIDEAGPAFWITARAPGPRLDQHLDPAPRRHAEKPETQEPAKFAHARVALAAAAPRNADRKPDFVASRGPIDPLQHELEVEAKLQLTDDDKRRSVPTQRDEIAAADFALHVKTEGLEEAFHRDVK